MLKSSNFVPAHKSDIDNLAGTLNALLDAAQQEDWSRLEVLEPELRLTLKRLEASPSPVVATDSYRKTLQELLLIQQQVSDRCTNRMKQISPLLDALSATTPASK